ncbi:MAG: 2Fe-2S iron-sulfur cluster-binding protein [Bacillota bacterium]|nr:2Fe-2S iron-sulfur cluster-binding protein [Bacillota bacterium]
MIPIVLNVNDVDYEIMIKPGEMLLETLRKIGFTSVKKGCDTGSCGVCSILLNGKVIPSCSYFTGKVQNKKIITIDGVEEKAREIGEFLLAEGVDQCGFCSPGLIMSIIAMENELNEFSEYDIKHYLVGNLCRCTGYEGQIRAIKKYLEVS